MLATLQVGLATTCHLFPSPPRWFSRRPPWDGHHPRTRGIRGIRRDFSRVFHKKTHTKTHQRSRVSSGKSISGNGMGEISPNLIWKLLIFWWKSTQVKVGVIANLYKFHTICCSNRKKTSDLEQWTDSGSS